MATEKAALAMSKLRWITDTSFNVMKPNQVLVFAGDFNFDPRPGVPHSPMTLSGIAMFAPMVSLGITSPTMLVKVGDATLAGQFPGYGYLRDICLDNIYYAYMPQTQEVNPKNPTVVNAVIGGGNDYDFSVMEDSIPDILNMDMLDGDEKNVQFRLPRNYGHIAHGKQGVSDHLPIVIDL
jgi:hypothetical protein